MSFKDDKKRKEKISPGSTDYFRQDEKGDLKENSERIESRDSFSTTTQLKLLNEKIKMENGGLGDLNHPQLFYKGLLFAPLRQ